MSKIMRKIATLSSGDYKRHGGIRPVELLEQPVQIIGRAPGVDEDEDQYLVQAYNIPDRLIVDGCDLHPHPESSLTNVEFITELMERGSPMRQLFVIDAIGKLANAVAAAKPEAIDGGMISGAGWVETAKEIKAEIDDKYGQAG